MDLGDAPVRPQHGLGAASPRPTPTSTSTISPTATAASPARSSARIIPDAVPGSTMEDLVTATVDYAAMDRAENPVRLRLGASVVKVAHDGDPATAATSVTLTYVEEGALKTVTGSQVILACWHRVIPHITDELPAAQVEALNDQVKTPLVYANVLVRNFEAFAKLGIGGFSTVPSGFWSRSSRRRSGLDGRLPVRRSRRRTPFSFTSGRFPASATACSARDQATAGRYRLTTMTFEDMERMHPRPAAARPRPPAASTPRATSRRSPSTAGATATRSNTCGPGTATGRDGPLPIETARKGWGRIAIANADSGAYAYAHSAIDQAGRAVNELIGGIEGFSHRVPGTSLAAR